MLEILIINIYFLKFTIIIILVFCIKKIIIFTSGLNLQIIDKQILENLKMFIKKIFIIL